MHPEDETHRHRARGTPAVGLLPAAGYARRLRGLAGSKEAQVVRHAAGDPRPAACAAVEQLRAAGLARAYVVLREDKEDVRACLGDGSGLGVSLEYLMTPGTASVAHSVDLAHARVGDADVALAWPDVLYEPGDALARTLARLRESGADVCLGVFPTRPGDRFERVLADPDGSVRALSAPAEAGGPASSWVLAAWRAPFSDFLHRYLAGGGDAPARRRGARELSLGHVFQGARELSLGHVFQGALDAGLALTSLRLDEGRFLDIGVPDDLSRARHTGPERA